MWEYTDKVRDHFFNPRNVGEIDDADAVAEVGSLACGDALKVYLKVDHEKRITDIKFKTFGCGSAIAAASALTEMVKGKTLNEAKNVTNKDIAEYLGGLPPEKMHCSVMGQEALIAAINNYGTAPETSREEEDEGKIVCHCFGVTEDLVRKVIVENNLTTVEEVTNYCKAGGGCRGCVPDIEDILLDTHREQEKVQPAIPSPKKRMTNVQKILKIKEILDEEIRSTLKKHGGDIELIDVDGNTVYVALRGMCSSCPSSGMTIKSYVEVKLREFVSEDLHIVEVQE